MGATDSSLRSPIPGAPSAGVLYAVPRIHQDPDRLGAERDKDRGPVMLETIGWIGATALAVSALPQAVQSVRQGHSHGVSRGLLWLWLVGEVCCLVYVSGTSRSAPLELNYAANMLLVGIVAWYSYRPRSR